MKWIYAGGIPYTPIDKAASSEINRIILDHNKIYAERFPDYHSLNVRFDRRFYFYNSNLIIYFSLWNAYNRKNVASYIWNEIENTPQTVYLWGTLPILGVEYEF